MVMSGYGEPKWHEECFGRCTSCASCFNFDNNNGESLTVPTKGFVSVGTVRYGLRLGAVSPPPPGAGPRYRSRCCWPTSGTGPVSRIPLLTASSNNSHDIFSCVNRVRMTEDATSDQIERATVRDQVLHSTKTLLKSQLRRRGPLRPQVYARLCQCEDGEREEILSNLDRLPRFRFGGNRGRGKKDQDQPLKEITEKIRRGPSSVPIPPPRTKHPHRTTQSPTSIHENDENESRQFPLRSASFSQLDYSLDDNKYVRRRPPGFSEPQVLSDNSITSAALTLPRKKSVLPTFHEKSVQTQSVSHQLSHPQVHAQAYPLTHHQAQPQTSTQFIDADLALTPVEGSAEVEQSKSNIVKGASRQYQLQTQHQTQLNQPQHHQPQQHQPQQHQPQQLQPQQHKSEQQQLQQHYQPQQQHKSQQPHQPQHHYHNPSETYQQPPQIQQQLEVHQLSQQNKLHHQQQEETLEQLQAQSQLQQLSQQQSNQPLSPQQLSQQQQKSEQQLQELQTQQHHQQSQQLSNQQHLHQQNPHQQNPHRHNPHQQHAHQQHPHQQKPTQQHPHQQLPQQQHPQQQRPQQQHPHQQHSHQQSPHPHHKPQKQSPKIKQVSQPDDPTKLEEKPPITRNSVSNLSAEDVTNAEEKRRDKSRRRKGMYISQWPNSYEAGANIIPQFVESGDFTSYADNPKAPNAENLDSLNTLNATIPRLQISFDKSDQTESSVTEPTSPEENISVDWSTPRNSGRPNLSGQNSEERENYVKKGFQFLRADSLSEGEPEPFERRTDLLTLASSDASDCENRPSIGNESSPHIPRRYSKRPLRGPYGQMLEAEMKKPEADRKNQYTSDLKFLEDLSSGIGTCSVVSLSSSSSVGAGDPKPKYVTRIRGSSNHSMDDSQLKHNLCVSPTSPSKYPFQVTKRKVSADCASVSRSPSEAEQKILVCHQRTTSSPSKLEGFSNMEASNELLEQLLRGSSEQLAAAEANLQRYNDTRTHVVVELYDTERSYVESLQTIVTKYLEPLKNPELQTLLDVSLVDEIFYQIPTLQNIHQTFLDNLKDRLDHWDVKQKVGDVFLDLFSNPLVMDAYSNYVNNWKRARETLKNAQSTKPGFAKFLEVNAREHKGKLALDSLLIKPIQKFPKYELLLQRLIKHTDLSHPDHELLLAAQKNVHDELLKLNCTEKEAVELDQLREIESVIEGLIELVSSDRQYLRHDFVNMTGAGGTRKERALFLFTDLLLITSIKRRSGTIRRPPPTSSLSVVSVTSTLEANKFKLLMKIALDDLEIVRAKDDTYKQMMMETENLTDDISVLNQIAELAWGLHCSHSTLDEVVQDMLGNLNKHLSEQHNNDNQLSCLDLTLTTMEGPETISIVFTKPEKRAAWEETFNEAKHKLAMSGDRRPCPELVATVPIRKTRAGLQFTCAAPTMSDIGNDVWVCNSDGYVGQVCVLSLQPEPTVTSCNGVCNARILCVASVPGISECTPSAFKINPSEEPVEDHSTIQFDSDSSSDDDASCMDEGDDKTFTTCKSMETGSIDSDEIDNQHSTMWLGTEDGCIHVYNSSDNIRIKKNKIRLQHRFAILCIIYYDNKVYVSLSNGEITIYERDCSGTWDTTCPTNMLVGSASTPVTKILPNGSKLWCACGNTVKVFNAQTLHVEANFALNNDTSKAINMMVISGNGVWLSLQNSAVVKCFHSTSYEFLCEVNVAPAVTKMLTCCDDIIRQHKAACLRVTSLLACKDLLWIGTSAGVLLTMPLPHITSSTAKLTTIPPVVGIPHGHTGHVRFLTHMEWIQPPENTSSQRNSCKGKPEQRSNVKLLVISGGDGYEDFRSSTVSEVAGREDSTNHLLLWNI